MAVVNGPIVLEEYELIQDASRPEILTLLLTSAGGEQYGLPLTKGQAAGLSAALDKAVKGL